VTDSPAPAPAEAAPPQRRTFAFLIGGVLAVLVGLPLVCVALFVLVRAGVGDAQVPWVVAARLALVFAGLPAFLTGGNVARLAARRADGAPIGQVGPRVFRSAIPAFTAAGAAWAILIMVPMGGLPPRPWPWALVATSGAAAGALTGAAVALAVWQRLLYSQR
jgi:hypothetical protein